MEIDKRPFYIWVVVWLANLGTVIATVIIYLKDGGYNLYSLLNGWLLAPLGFTLLITAVPVLVSNSKSEKKNFFGYGIPCLLILPILYFIYDYYTCTGKLCQLAPFLFGSALAIFAVTFSLFYAMATYSKKWSVRFVQSLIWIEVTLLVGLGLYFGFPGQFKYYFDTFL